MALTEAEELELLELEEQEALAQAPRASQADVRAAEPVTPMDRQRESERQFEAARQVYLRKHGTLPRGKPQAQAISEMSGLPDPTTTREQAEIEHLRETGELTYGDSGLYQVAKPAAAIAGFAFGGPGAATAAEGLVRLQALAHNLDKAVKAGAIDEDRAAEILSNEMMKGSATDAAFNFGLPVLGQLIAKIPGVKWLGTKVRPLIERAIGSSAPQQSLRDAKVESRVALTDDPARQQAVRELSGRVEGFVPTPGQVRGEVGATETIVNKAFPAAFEKQEKALGEAAEGMRREFMYPGGQPSAKQLGERITSTADAVVKKTKERLRPTFQAADEIGVAVDMNPVAEVAKKALAEDAKVYGGKLTEAERAHLEKIVADNAKVATSSAEAALDFISVQKEKARSLNVDGKPTDAFAAVVRDLGKAADDAYSAAARGSGKGDVVRKLELARKDYRTMMETIYDDAVKQSLKKNPEDVGRLFWQAGNQSEIEQLHKVLALAQKEGAVGKGYADKMKRDVTRGFLQEAVQDVKAASEWSKTLAKDPKKARTWEALTAGPEGKALRDGMKVLEHASQMAALRSTAKDKSFIPLGRAASGGLGVSYVTGVIHPGMAVIGLSIAGTMKAMSTAYTHGDKGAINLLARVLRTNSAGTAAAAKAMQSMLPDLEKLAAEYGAEDMFVGEETE